MKLCHVVKYTIYGHVKLECQCYFKCIYLDLAVVNIVEGGIDMVDTTNIRDKVKNREKERRIFICFIESIYINLILD
jgi:hypothetical protein